MFGSVYYSMQRLGLLASFAGAAVVAYLGLYIVSGLLVLCGLWFGYSLRYDPLSHSTHETEDM